VVPETVGCGIQFTSEVGDDTVQFEPPVTVTAKLKLPPAASADAELDSSEYEQVVKGVM